MVTERIIRRFFRQHRHRSQRTWYNNVHNAEPVTFSDNFRLVFNDPCFLEVRQSPVEQRQCGL